MDITPGLFFCQSGPFQDLKQTLISVLWLWYICVLWLEFLIGGTNKILENVKISYYDNDIIMKRACLLKRWESNELRTRNVCTYVHTFSTSFSTKVARKAARSPRHEGFSLPLTKSILQYCISI